MDETTRCRWSPHGLLFVIVTFVLVAPSSGLNDPTLPPGLLYPFGEDVGDEVVEAMDDGYAGPIKLNTSFPLKNESYTQLYVSDQNFLAFCYTLLIDCRVSAFWVEADFESSVSKCQCSRE